jgi:hypothetical protein
MTIQTALGLIFEAHDSAYFGEYYRAAFRTGQRLQLRRNADPLFDERTDPPEERFVEPAFPDARLLLYVHGTELEGIHQALERVPGISLLSEREMA